MWYGVSIQSECKSETILNEGVQFDNLKCFYKISDNSIAILAHK